MLACYVNKPKQHAVSTPNIIPERSEMSYNIRGLTDDDVLDLEAKVKNCAEGAALVTGMC